MHCAKPSNSYKKDLKYLSRYIKRPPIAESRLKHYDGNYVAFKYLDHKTKLFRHFKLTTEDFIAKFISHIHDVNFRTIRYYGFLSNRLISDLKNQGFWIVGFENSIEAKEWHDLNYNEKLNATTEKTSSRWSCTYKGRRKRGKTSEQQQ